MRAAQEANANGSKSAPNGPKAAAMSGSKISVVNGSNKVYCTNGSKTTNGGTSRAKAKATNGCKSTNPKKKAKSMYLKFP